jgi:ATP-binding cassette subfamily F protein 3
MIQLADISLHFGPQTLFEHCALAVPPGKHYGLVGQNGSGKSTLLKMIAGLSEPSSGQVVVPKGTNIAYLPQEIAGNRSSTPLLAEVLTVFDHIFDIEKQMRQLELKISQTPSPEILEEYALLQERFHRLNGYQAEAHAKEILSGLGFKEDDFPRPVSSFSGGWQMRIALAKILLDEPDCLLLDEPTNHLDMETLVWLENFLAQFRGTLILVSHDRYFLDKLVDGIIEVENARVTTYKGNYTDYEVQKENRIEHELAVMKNQERKIAHMEQFIERFRYKASKARQVQSRIKQLSKITLHKTDTSGRTIRFAFPQPERSGDPVAAGDRLSFRYDKEPVFSRGHFEIRRGEKAALVGMNGTGKSTLMKLICGELQVQEGSLKLGYNLRIGYFAQHHLDQLNLRNSVLDEIWNAAPHLPRNDVRSLLGRFLFSGEDTEKPVSVLSGGEKSRLVLMKILLSKANFLILDEPTNHLDMQSKEILAEALDEFRGSVLIVSHDRFFLDMLVTKVIYFKNKEIKEFLGNFSEYEDKILSPMREERSGDEISDSPDRKAQKRREAEERQKRYRALKGVREELSALEKQIAELDTRKHELDTMFMSPEFKNLSLDEMRKLSNEHEQILRKLSRYEEQWLELQEKIEAY